MHYQRQKGNTMKPEGCLIRVTNGDRLREASGKFQPSRCQNFQEGNYIEE
jgi:hypothetical protein